jgi:hypothetical protein
MQITVTVETDTGVDAAPGRCFAARGTRIADGRVRSAASYPSFAAQAGGGRAAGVDDPVGVVPAASARSQP